MYPKAAAEPVARTQLKRLRQLSDASKTPQRVVLRSRIILMASEGMANRSIAKVLGISRPTVLLWRDRFRQRGVEALLKDAPRPGRRPVVSAQKVKEVVEATLHSTPPGATHWSTRLMAQVQGLSHMAVHRIWKQHGLQPHRVENFKFSRDPQFVQKLRDIVGLYLNPPARALVLSVDEKSQIQALDRTAPLLPLAPGIPARQTHDYKRNGTTTLFAALNMLDGRIIAQCLPRHRSREFIGFLNQIDRQTPAHLDLHLIVDNSSSHKSPPVKRWLGRHPRFHLHFTPTSSSWLNMIERWFGEITRKRIRRGTFKSVNELVQAIEEYIKLYNQQPRPFLWTKKSNSILAKINRCKEALVTGH